MPNPETTLEQARRYLRAIENGDAAYVASVFSPAAVIEQLPNRIYPNGLSADVSRVAEAFEKGRKIFARQIYEITNEVTTEDTVALEVLWTGSLAIPFGTLAAGSQVRCHSAMFLEFREGKIVAQRNYDCFEPW
jgi:ketosteroid isomerase-like protein